MANGDVWEEIKSRINLVDYASGVTEVEQRGSISFCSSPVNEDRDPSCALYPDHFKDWSSGEWGDIFDFIQLVQGVDAAEALNIAADYCGFELSDEHRERAQKLQKERSSIANRIEDAVDNRGDVFWQWVQSRGFSEETVDAFQLGWHEKNNAITIPIFDTMGRPASMSLRRIEGDPKYQHYNTSFFVRNRHLYNINLALQHEDGAPLYIVEGQLDVVALFEAGVETGLCTYGEEIAVGQVTLLADKFPERMVIYVPDQDETDEIAHKEKQRRAIGLLRSRTDNDIRVVKLSAEDTNDVLLQSGPDELLVELDQHEHSGRFLIDIALEDVETIEAEYDAAKRVIQGVGNALVVEDLCVYLADRWDKPQETVRSYMMGESNQESIALIKRVGEGISTYEEFVDSLANPVFRFPWPTFNSKIRAVAPGHKLAFIARTSVGKTMWLLNLLDHCCSQSPDEHIMFFSLEQPEVEIVSRLLAIQSASMDDPEKSISTREIEALCRMRTEDPEWSWRKQVFAQRYQNLSIVEEALSPKEIEATINEASMAYGPARIVFLDYLGLIEGRGEEYERISYIAKEMSNIANRTGVVLVYLHQISRKGEDGTKPVTLDHARGSGVVEESVDYLIGAWRPEGTDSPEFSAAILKNRHGTTGNALMYFDARTLSITEIEAPPPEEVYGEADEGDVSQGTLVGNDEWEEEEEDPFDV